MKRLKNILSCLPVHFEASFFNDSILIDSIDKIDYNDLFLLVKLSKKNNCNVNITHSEKAGLTIIIKENII